MNKYLLFGLILVLLVLCTYTINASEGLSSNIDLSDNVTVINDEEDVSVGGLIGLAGTFIRVITFQADGIPVFITLLVFYPLTGMLIYMLIDIFKDLVPFT